MHFRFFVADHNICDVIAGRFELKVVVDCNDDAFDEVCDVDVIEIIIICTIGACSDDDIVCLFFF